MGARAQLSDSQGTAEASVTAIFIPHNTPQLETLLDTLGIPTEDDTLIIRRIITREGKTKCYINDTPTSVGALKTLGEQLVEIHGQFDRLLSAQHHRAVLDDFAALAKDVDAVRSTHAVEEV